MSKNGLSKRIAISLACLLLCLPLVACADNGSSPIGASTETQASPGNVSPALSVPNFTVADESGNTVKLSDFSGHPIVLNFWASWCPPCKAEMPDFQEAYETYGDRIKFVIINLTDGQRETVNTATAYARGQGYTFPLYFDTTYSAANAYRVSSIPCTYFINAEGELSGAKVGMISASELEKEIGKLLR